VWVRWLLYKDAVATSFHILALFHSDHSELGHSRVRTSLEEMTPTEERAP
jgi:hypothetical protein